MRDRAVPAVEVPEDPEVVRPCSSAFRWPPRHHSPTSAAISSVTALAAAPEAFDEEPNDVLLSPPAYVLP